jgi:tRNA nucleotidyltransferase (CCA-adding enzyme)
MKSTPIMSNLQNGINHILEEHPIIREVVHEIDMHHGRALLVGGAVRDIFLGRESKDIDIEVHNLSLKKLEYILQKHGPVSTVGKSFGVLRVHSLDVDWSLPRTDSMGRKPIVKIDPSMSFKKAFERRDLTINAMGIDLKTKELIDPFGGQHDLEQKILRAPNPETFVEDPLRFYRVMQMIGRFEMYPDDELQALCRKMSLADVSRERIELEFEKLLLQSEFPSRGLRWLHEIGRLAEVLPELAATVGVEQDPRWHPEGDVFEHTMQALDAAAAIARTYDDRHKALVLLYTALCHDLGKATTTQKTPNGITSYNHEVEGVELGRSMLKHITENHDIKAAVLKLVRHHMTPVIFVKDGAKPSAYKRLANKLAPEATIALLGDLAYADVRGRNPIEQRPLTIDIPEIGIFLERAQEAHVRDTAEAPILKGRDLLDIMSPGKKMGELLDRAYEIQIEEGITDIETLKKRVLADHKI